VLRVGILSQNTPGLAEKVGFHTRIHRSIIGIRANSLGGRKSLTIATTPVVACVATAGAGGAAGDLNTFAPQARARRGRNAEAGLPPSRLERMDRLWEASGALPDYDGRRPGSRNKVRVASRLPLRM
jgi:hypothetical protein